MSFLNGRTNRARASLALLHLPGEVWRGLEEQSSILFSSPPCLRSPGMEPASVVSACQKKDLIPSPTLQRTGEFTPLLVRSFLRDWALRS